MSTSKARRDDALLVVIDAQERLAPAIEGSPEVVASIVRLVRVAGLLGVPIVYTEQNPRGLGGTVSAVATAIEQAGSTTSVERVEKMTFDCFAAADFTPALARTERSQIVVCGMETHICVAQTVLSAIDAGLDVHLVEDACGSRSRDRHDTALQRLRTAGCVVTSAESVIYEFVERAGTDEFRAVLQLVKE